MIQISIDVLVYVIFALFLFLLFLSAYLIVKRISEVQWNRKKQNYIEKRQDDWYRYFRRHDSDESILLPRVLIPRRQYEIEAIEEVFLSYVKNGEFPFIHQSINSYANMYFADYYRKQLVGKKWSKRMNVLHRIVDFQMDGLVEDCVALETRAHTSDEQFQLLRIYALFRPERFFKKILCKENRYSEYEYKKLFASVPDALFEQLIKRMEEMPLIGQSSLLDIIGSKRNPEHLPYLKLKLTHEHPEIRIRTLKAIHEIGYVHSLDLFIPFVDSEIWEERLMVVKILGKLPLERSRPYLQKLLHDPVWLVRSQAAVAIGSYKKGQEVLMEIVATSSDRYAIDMANEVLLRGM